MQNCFIILNMIEPKEISRSNRKTLALTITRTGDLIVRAPFNLPEFEIFKFIEEKDSWIKSKIAKIKKREVGNPDLINYQSFLLFGKRYKTILSSDVKSAVFTAENCVVPKGKTREECLHKVVLLYKRLAKKWLEERTSEISKVLGLPFSEFKISDTKGRWGACSSKKVINLNFRVVCLPPQLIDYVIVHELTHTKEMNHSPKFWEKVERVLPDYKKRRKALKDLNFLFEIY